MSPIHPPDSPPIPATPPEIGARYWWYASPRRLLMIQVDAIDPASGAVTLTWWLYVAVGSLDDGDSLTGMVIWTDAEWSAAYLRPYRSPTWAADCGPGEELCRACRGGYFEVLGGGEVVGCMMCGGTGKIERRPERKGKVGRRSGLHPAVDSNG